MTIRRELAEHTGREIAVGAIYTALARLETRGYVDRGSASRRPERGGRAKRFYRVLPAGAKAVERAEAAFVALGRELGRDAGPVMMAARASPPRLARWLLRRALAGPARSAIVGDIEEEFACYVAPRLGARAARRWYWRQTVLSIAACLRGPDAPQPARPQGTSHVPGSTVRGAARRRRRRAAADAPRARRSPRWPPRRWRSASAPTAPSSRWSTRRCCGRCRCREPDRLVMLSERTDDRIARAACRRPTCSTGTTRNRTFERDRRLLAARRRHGDDRRRRHAPRPCRASGSRPGSSTSRRRARSSAARSGRPTTRRARQRGRPQRGVLAHALRRRSRRRRPRSSASTASRSPSSASCPRTSSSPGAASLWALLPIDRDPGARAARTSCRRSAG